MKSVFKVLGLIALVAVIGFGFVSCDNGGGSDTSLSGTTWTGSVDVGVGFGPMPITLTFTGSTYTVTMDGMGIFDTGTYSVSGNNITFISDLDDEPMSGTLNGQTLTVTGIGTFTKQGGSSNSGGEGKTPGVGGGDSAGAIEQPAISLTGTTWTGSVDVGFGMMPITLTFTGSNYTVTAGMGMGNVASGTYSVFGNNVSFQDDDEGPMTGTLSNGGNTLTVNGIGTFTKQ